MFPSREDDNDVGCRCSLCDCTVCVSCFAEEELEDYYREDEISTGGKMRQTCVSVCCCRRPFTSGLERKIVRKLATRRLSVPSFLRFSPCEELRTKDCSAHFNFSLGSRILLLLVCSQED